MASVEVDRFLERLNGVRKDGSGWMARCPCRDDDSNPSLHVAEGDDGRVLVTCHRGTPCSLDQICDAVDLEVKDLMPPMRDKEGAPKLTLVKVYNYYGADGTLLFQKQRFADQFGKKTFRQRKPDGSGGWTYSLGSTPKILYNLPQVLFAKASGQHIWVVEGEKDADAVMEAGEVATTMPNGAGSWQQLHTDFLAGATITIIADNDKPGLDHAFDVYRKLSAAGCTVNICRPPDNAKDVAELLGRGEPLGMLIEVDPEETDIEVKEPNPFDVVIDKVNMLAANDKFSIQQKLTRVQDVIDRIQFGDDIHEDKGILVDWQDFIDEDVNEDYDWLIPGVLERQERVIIVAAEGVGKRATITSMIPTPSGWTTLGEIKVGDKVFDRFGNPVNVTYVSPIEKNPDAYRVHFSDGNFIDADAEHQWYTETLNEREKRKVGGVRTTKEIQETLISNRITKALNHAIPTTKPLNLPEVLLPIAPYTLGAWLGDGASNDGSICSEDQQILDNIQADGFDIRHRQSTKNIYGILGLQQKLNTHGLKNNKHIPAIYARASFEQRLAVIQGLMDTDGTVGINGTCEFSVNLKVLAEGFLDLLLTLGVKATMHESASKLYGRVTGTRYRVSFKTDLPVFRLDRKKDRLPKKLSTPRSLYRYITKVEKIEPTPMLCISVDGPDNTYLIGESYIPTHNTMLARQVAICSAAGIQPFTRSKMKPIRTLTIDLENPARIIRRTSSKIMAQARDFGRVSRVDAHLLIKPAGLDLLTSRDRILVEDTIDRIKPDLICIGPLYKAFIDPGGRTSESVAIEIARYLDTIRTTYNCALWMEHHAPLGNTVSGRDLRPFGSAVWSRWPEFGLALEPDPTAMERYTYNVKNFRGERDVRNWPTKMQRDEIFPFRVLEYKEVS